MKPDKSGLRRNLKLIGSPKQAPAPIAVEAEQNERPSITSGSPMTREEAVANLRSILADLYPDEPSARLVVSDTGLNSKRIAFSNTAINTWFAILREAENTSKIEALFQIVLREYETNSILRAAIDAYRRQAKGTSGPPKGVPQGVRDSATIKILFLAANPTDTTPLRLDEEIRSIDQALRQGEFRDQVKLEQHWAVRVTDLQSLLLRHQPHIVHFSGHGSEASEIILEDNAGKSRPVSPQALSTVFSLLKDNIRCVILNACYSERQAQAIAEHIDCVIGMSKAIGDKAAISFATAFYQALGFGRDVKTAFDLGRAQIDLENISEEQTPQLLSPKADPTQVVLQPHHGQTF